MTSPLHVAFVHDALPPYRRPLFNLVAQRHRVTFFFTNVKDGSLAGRCVSVRGYRLPQMSDYVVAPTLFRELKEFHRRDPFDVVILPDLGNFSCQIGYFFARLSNLPYALWSGEWLAVGHPRRWLMAPLERSIVQSAAACLAYGSRAKRRLRQLGASEERIRASGNASDYRFSPPAVDDLAEIRQEWSIGDRRVILFLGRLLEFKAPDVLLEAFVRMGRSGNAYLVMAGQGPLLGSLQGRARQRRLTNVHFTGQVVNGDQEKNLLYGLASAFVLPSRRWRTVEPWGLVLNEAASARLPIVATEWVGAVGDLIRDGETGYVIPGDEPGTLAEAILDILQRPEQAKERGLRAREVASQFTIERMAGAIDWAIQTAADARP